MARLRWVSLALLLAFSQVHAQPGAQRILMEGRLRSPLPAERSAVLREFKLHPYPDSLGLILLVWQKDLSAEVRTCAGDALYGWKSDPKVRSTFLGLIKREVGEANALLAGVWLAGTPLAEHGEMLDLLARAFEKRPANSQVLIPVAEFLGSRDEADAVKALTAFTKLAVFRQHFAFRRSVVQALTSVRRPEAIDTLVDVMPDSDGEIVGDIAIHLTRISGEPFGNDAKGWRTWWLNKRGTFEFPEPTVAKARQIMIKDQVKYYGIPVYAKKVLFVIDTSGSMVEKNRIGNAKNELKKTVTGLPTTTQFNVVAYNSTLIPWHRALQPVNDTTKKNVSNWINRLKAEDSTHTYDALKTAMDQHPEAIYLLTDGKPTGGTLVNPADILEAIKQTNKYRRTTIHVIGLDPGPPDGVFSKFLEELAAQNWGQYRRVD
jgi:hypothetical protein